jgi:Holliday junction resolvase RusA-like endonuclease
MRIRALFPRPKRLRRKRDPDGPIVHAQKPDVDNVAKAVMDAMGEFWADDAQVHALAAEKYFVEKTGTPRVEVWIYDLGGQE